MTPLASFALPEFPMGIPNAIHGYTVILLSFNSISVEIEVRDEGGERCGLNHVNVLLVGLISIRIDVEMEIRAKSQSRHISDDIDIGVSTCCIEY